MFLILLFLAQQPVPERFSILIPEACSPEAWARTEASGDVLVCADPAGSQRLPLPDDALPIGPLASNPHLTGRAALAAEGTPCAALQGGCQVGFGQPVIAAAVGALVDLVKDAARPRPDKSKRVPIPID
ncbi:MAG TPA: hypothetical protein VF592_05150 [Sphingomonas sp.]|jgi:hypothetical protein|uniref:hypothetical protein n=1 Tax=Sphingomonas sp. TaxID=28214 RepID=UPI002ED8A4B4